MFREWRTGQQLTPGGFRDPSPSPPPRPPLYSMAPPPPLSVVPPDQDDVPHLLMTSTKTNMIQCVNTGLMTPPQPPRWLPPFTQSPCFSGGAASPGIPAPAQDAPPLSTSDGSLFQMGRSDSGYSNSGRDLLIGAPNATRPSPSLLPDAPQRLWVQ